LARVVTECASPWSNAKAAPWVLPSRVPCPRPSIALAAGGHGGMLESGCGVEVRVFGLTGSVTRRPPRRVSTMTSRCLPSRVPCPLPCTLRAAAWACRDVESGGLCMMSRFVTRSTVTLGQWRCGASMFVRRSSLVTQSLSHESLCSRPPLCPLWDGGGLFGGTQSAASSRLSPFAMRAYGTPRGLTYSAMRAYCTREDLTYQSCSLFTASP